MRVGKGVFASFAVLMLVSFGGMVGCGNDKIDVDSMAGTYNFTKLTGIPRVTVVFTPPDIGGSLTLTKAGTFMMNITMLGDVFNASGTFAVNDPDILLMDAGGVTSGKISNGGDTITVTESNADIMVEMVFTKI